MIDDDMTTDDVENSPPESIAQDALADAGAYDPWSAQLADERQRVEHPDPAAPDGCRHWWWLDHPPTSTAEDDLLFHEAVRVHRYGDVAAYLHAMRGARQEWERTHPVLPRPGVSTGYRPDV